MCRNHVQTLIFMMKMLVKQRLKSSLKNSDCSHQCVRLEDKCTDCWKTGFTREEGCVYSGTLVGRKFTDDWESCTRECWSTNGCQGVVFNFKNKKCELKKYVGQRKCGKTEKRSGILCASLEQCKFSGNSLPLIFYG